MLYRPFTDFLCLSPYSYGHRSVSQHIAIFIFPLLLEVFDLHTLWNPSVLECKLKRSRTFPSVHT